MADPTARLIRRLRRAAQDFNEAFEGALAGGLEVEAKMTSGGLVVAVSRTLREVLVGEADIDPDFREVIADAAGHRLANTLNEAPTMTEARDPAPDPLAIPEEFRR